MSLFCIFGHRRAQQGYGRKGAALYGQSKFYDAKEAYEEVRCADVVEWLWII